MGELDEKYATPNMNFPIYELLSKPVGVVTSRDQIINPYDYVKSSDFLMTKRGRANYENTLAALIEYQKQQEASYEEWYNSPEQAALRQREAGLNPDLVGLDGAGEASQVDSPDMVPGQGLPTSGESATQIMGAISQLASTGASLAGLPLQFSQLQGQKLVNEGLKLDNEAKEILNTSALSADVTDYIEGSLATAVQAHNDSDSASPFDYDAFFADETNFEPIRKLYKDNPRFEQVLDVQRKQVLKHRKNMVALQKDWASDQFDFGLIAGDRMFSSDQKILLATNLEVMGFFHDVKIASLKRQQIYDEVDASIKKGLNVQTAIDAANEDNEYRANLDGRKKAADEEFRRACEIAAFKRKNKIDANLFKLWDANPSSLEAQAAMYLLGGMHSNQWSDFMISYGTAYMLDSVPRDPSTGLPNTGSPLTDWSINPTGSPGLRDNPARAFGYPGSIMPFIP